MDDKEAQTRKTKSAGNWICDKELAKEANSGRR
jgi:hypothetical protein